MTRLFIHALLTSLALVAPAVAATPSTAPAGDTRVYDVRDLIMIPRDFPTAGPSECHPRTTASLWRRTWLPQRRGSALRRAGPRARSGWTRSFNS